MICRHCGAHVKTVFIDLGSSPPSNAYLTDETLSQMERWYPLRVMVCSHCWLVQTEERSKSEDLFTSDYAYFSSCSSTWLAHAKYYVDRMAEKMQLGGSSLVIEIAANDGYLLQYVKEKGIPCLGIEPTASTATAARSKGLMIVEDFFGTILAERLVREGKKADLVVANNVLAHVPDINDFVLGISMLLKDSGVATFEFPHLYRLMEKNQFDTIYHEHFSYLSLIAVTHIFQKNGLFIFDVEELPTHGGSLRVYAAQKGSERNVTKEPCRILELENAAGMTTPDPYIAFQNQANRIKNDFLRFLLRAKSEGKMVIGYGAAAKGNTLINYAGVKQDLIPYVVDISPSKIGKFLPGSRIPILKEEQIRRDRPEFVIILPWNLKDEIVQQLSYIREWNGKFVVAVSELSII